MSIRHTAKQLDIKLGNDLIEDSNAHKLIRYYFLISHDQDMFNILETARKQRNTVTHNMHKTKSMDEINKNAKKAAKFNLDNILGPMFDREEGKIVPPVLMIQVNARNDLRKELRAKVIKKFGPR